MAPEFLSVTPQRVRCYVCGTFSDSPDNWKYRLRLGGHSPVCPSCLGRAEMELEQMTGHPNVAGAVLLGLLAAIAGSVAWCGFTILHNREYFVLALGIGWLVGKAVVLGSGNKRGQGLQVIAGVLAFAGIVGGRYFLLNHFLRIAMPDKFSSWLTFRQFMVINGRLLKHGNGIGDFICSVIAVAYSLVLPLPDRLDSEPPTGVRGWQRWVR